MKSLLKKWVLVKLLFVAAVALRAAVPYPRLAPQAYVGEFAGISRTSTVEELVELSLHMSGTPVSSFSAYRRQFLRLIEQFRTASAGTASVELAEGILTFIHEEVLTKYEEKQTRIDVLLERGIFNCVSSSVMYLVLAYAVDLEIWGVKTVDHAFCRVATVDAAYDVETTNPYGFNPGEKKQFTDEFGNVTGFNYVPPGNYRDRTEISMLELMGLILQNRITFHTEKREYAQAAELAVDYWSLLETEESFEVLVNAFMNMWPLYNTGAGFTTGIRFYDETIERFGSREKLLSTRSNLVHNYLVTLLEASRLEEAQAFLDQRETAALIDEAALKKYRFMLTLKQVQDVAVNSYPEAIATIRAVISRYGEDRDLLELKKSYVHNYIVEQIRRNQLEQAYAAAASYRTAGDLVEKDWKELIGFIYQKRAEQAQPDFLAAAQILAAGLAEIGETREMRKQYEAYLFNYEVTVHNEMVRLYNRQDYNAAKKLLEAALEQAPRSRRLQEDLELVLAALDQ